MNLHLVCVSFKIQNSFPDKSQQMTFWITKNKSLYYSLDHIKRNQRNYKTTWPSTTGNTGKGKLLRNGAAPSSWSINPALQVAQSRPGEVKTLPWRVTEADRGGFCAEGKREKPPIISTKGKRSLHSWNPRARLWSLTRSFIPPDLKHKSSSWGFLRRRGGDFRLSSGKKSWLLKSKFRFSKTIFSGDLVLRKIWILMLNTHIPDELFKEVQKFRSTYYGEKYSLYSSIEL